MSTPKILVFAGSTRTGSYNKQLAHLAADAARTAGASVTFLDLRDLPLPLFDQDFETEHGLPDNAKKLKALFRDHDGFIIASPEYNSSITAALLSASPGALGGLRGLVHLRAILGNIGVIVLPDQVAVPKAHEAFDAAGQLKEERPAKQVTALAQGLVSFLKKHLG